jgi:hypothetical protein
MAYLLSFEVDSDNADPSDLLDRLHEAVGERFWGVDEQTVSVLTLDPKAIRLGLNIVPDTETPGEVGPITKESLARFLRNANDSGVLETKCHYGAGRVIRFKSLSVE